MSGPVSRRAILEAAARVAGFDAFGVCPSVELHPEREHYLHWLEQGRAGEMAWITREWVHRATDPSGLLEDAKSIVCVALSYAGSPAIATPTGQGRIARYANGRDYHELLASKLDIVRRSVEEMGGRARSFVDSSPTMDKALASRAGIGWQGKNTNILNSQLGSFFFLGGLITTLDISADIPIADGCGTCRACVAICPTGALRGDYTIDARLCISYLTIEHRGPIPRALRPLIGDWVFGCDLCQDVCPPVGAIHDRDYPTQRPARIAFLRSALSSESSGG